MTTYDVIGSNGPTDQRVIYSARFLKNALLVARGALRDGADFHDGHKTFQTVQVFKTGRTLGRLVFTA